MSGFVLDTSIYIRDLRGDGTDVLNARTLNGGLVWLSAVVLEELYAGATQDARFVARLERDFTSARRILLPSAADWATVGKVLAEFGTRYGYEFIGRGRLTNDALIAMSASRMGLTIITANSRDFARLATLRHFTWRLA